MSVSADVRQQPANNPAAVLITGSRRHLVGPVADFLLLGGGSILPLLAVAYYWPTGSDTAGLAAATLLLANLINHPHFAHSYQLFYRNFRQRAFGSHFPAGLRRRYVVAAIGVPCLLVAFFGYCLLAGDPVLLGRAANLMFFLVGWHYVKQGYGMLMVDSALKRNFFAAREKNLLLINAYAVWMVSYLLANRIFESKNYLGLSYYTFATPDWILRVATALMVMTGVACAYVIARKCMNRQQAPLPFNGMVAYMVSLYLWLLVRHPAMMLVIPAFHSLQYLAVVWRYRLNMERDHQSSQGSLFPGRGVVPGFLLFVFVGCVLGYVGFWMAPYYLQSRFHGEAASYSNALFLFIFWIFINVHHYFIDNVMWRKDNPDTRKYLFGS